MRYRTRTRSSVGSMWMSDARSRRPCMMISWTTCTTGASSLADTFSSRSASRRSESRASKACTRDPTLEIAR
jgi:hypothetical protein